MQSCNLKTFTSNYIKAGNQKLKKMKSSPIRIQNHVLLHNETPTFKHMAPTWHPHTSQLGAQHGWAGGAGGFTLPASTEPIQKLILPALGFKEPGQPPALRMRRSGAEEEEEAGQERKEEEEEEEEETVEEWHHLPWNVTIISGFSFSRLERWHHPLHAPPPPPLLRSLFSARLGSLFVCVHEGVCTEKLFFFFHSSESGCLSASCLFLFIYWQKAASVALFLSRWE